MSLAQVNPVGVSQHRARLSSRLACQSSTPALATPTSVKNVLPILTTELASLLGFDLQTLPKDWQPPQILELYLALESWCERYHFPFEYKNRCLRDPQIFAGDRQVKLLDHLTEAQVAWKAICFAYGCRVSSADGSVIFAFSKRTKASVSAGSVGIAYPWSRLMVFTDSIAIILRHAKAWCLGGDIIAYRQAKVSLTGDGRLWAMRDSVVSVTAGTVFAYKGARVQTPLRDAPFKVVWEGDPDWQDPDPISLLLFGRPDFWKRI